MVNIIELHEALEAVCPIKGVSVGRVDDKSTWRINFSDEATEAQQAAAMAVCDGFTFSGAAPPQQRNVEQELDALKAQFDALSKRVPA